LIIKEIKKQFIICPLFYSVFLPSFVCGLFALSLVLMMGVLTCSTSTTLVDHLLNFAPGFAKKQIRSMPDDLVKATNQKQVTGAICYNKKISLW